MKKIIKAPPISTQSLIPGNKLAEALQCLIGQHLSLKAQIRTIGSNLRKMIEEVITELSLPGAVDSAYKLQTKKGLPKIMIALCDSYVVTTGNSYNLQVWNRRPNSHVQLVKYSDGSKVMCKDIRCILVKINTEKELIESIVIMTPDYIEKHFGAFGVPTVKYQLIISESKRKEILETDSSMLIGNDTETMKKFICKDFVIPEFLLAEEPRVGKILSIDVIKRKVADHLIGVKLQGVNTKTCGQDLERKVAGL